jgi:hypothetical protein
MYSEWALEPTTTVIRPSTFATMKHHTYLAEGLCGIALISEFTDAAEPKEPKKGRTPQSAAALTDAGKALEAKYAAMQTALRSEIEAALPERDDARIAAWLEATKAEEGPAKEDAAKEGEVAKMQAAEGKLRHPEENPRLGAKTLEDAKAELQRAKAKGEENPKKEKLLANAEKFLASRQKEMDGLQAGIEKAGLAVKQAEAGLPAAIKAAEAAQQAHEKAMAATWKAMAELGTGGILGSDAPNGKLARYVVTNEATPRGLAEFAQQSPENSKLIQQLLANEDLMIQMLVADAPKARNYGQAMKTFTDNPINTYETCDHLPRRSASLPALPRGGKSEGIHPFRTVEHEWWR